MAVLSREVTVTDSATRLDSTADDEDRLYGCSIIIRNQSSDTVVKLGGSGASAQKLQIAAGSWSPGMDLGPSESLYGVVASGSAVVEVFETGIG